MADERDEVICELFASLKELSQLRMRYDRAVSEGYVNLAKTRYNIGSGSSCIINKLQYPNEMMSSTQVQCNVDNNDEDILAPPTNQLFELTQEDNDSFAQSKTNTASELRYRRPHEDTSHDETLDLASSKSTRKDSEGSGNNKTRVDPIRWFSALPPMSLRNSQKQFQEALEIVVILVSVQSRVELLRKRYTQLCSEENNEPETIRAS